MTTSYEKRLQCAVAIMVTNLCPSDPFEQLKSISHHMAKELGELAAAALLNKPHEGLDKAVLTYEPPEVDSD